MDRAGPHPSPELTTDDNFVGEADAVYEALVRAHAGLGDQDSAALDARLVLILANQVGDPALVLRAIRAARASIDGGGAAGG